MKAQYFGELVATLLAGSTPKILRVEPVEPAADAAYYWGPYTYKVVLIDGTALYCSVTGTSPFRRHDDEGPEHITEEEIAHVHALRSTDFGPPWPTSTTAPAARRGQGHVPGGGDTGGVS